MSQPEIALLLSTYQRPAHLRRALASIALQAGVAGRMELVMTDDGSTDETAAIVQEFARTAPFPVGFTTHPHKSFQLSRCRNEGARASRAPYLLFMDGDCILPPDHARIHLEHRQPGVVMAGDCVRLDQETSARITLDTIQRGEFQNIASPNELRRLKRQARASWFYRLLRHPTKPKLIGNNVGIWRADFERINGYDENFQGWGCEDDDLRFRLRRSGVHVESILPWTHTFHLWHPNEPSLPALWKQGANVNYLLRKGRLTRCRNGLEKRPLADLAIHVIGQPNEPHAVARLFRGRFGSRRAIEPEVEILFLPGEGRFSGQAECNVVVALDAHAARSSLARRAHLTITSPAADSLDQIEQALASVA
jgi:glycosyltransferase involved in cell wall biosynthesis